MQATCFFTCFAHHILSVNLALNNKTYRGVMPNLQKRSKSVDLRYVIIEQVKKTVKHYLLPCDLDRE